MPANGYQQLMSDMSADQAQSPSSGVQDKAAEAMFRARDDIRHKLVEEGWYGQQTTGNVELPDTSTYDPAPPEGQGNIWGNGEGMEWNEGGSIWSNENNAGVWGHENAPQTSSTRSIEAPEAQPSEIECPSIEEPDIER